MIALQKSQSLYKKGSLTYIWGYIQQFVTPPRDQVLCFEQDDQLLRRGINLHHTTKY